MWPGDIPGLDFRALAMWPGNVPGAARRPVCELTVRMPSPRLVPPAPQLPLTACPGPLSRPLAHDGLAQAMGVRGRAASCSRVAPGSSLEVVTSQVLSLPGGPLVLTARDPPCPSPSRKVPRPGGPLNSSPLDSAAGADVPTPHQEPPALPLPALRSPQRRLQGGSRGPPGLFLPRAGAVCHLTCSQRPQG